VSDVVYLCYRSFWAYGFGTLILTYLPRARVADRSLWPADDVRSSVPRELCSAMRDSRVDLVSFVAFRSPFHAKLHLTMREVCRIDVQFPELRFGLASIVSNELQR